MVYTSKYARSGIYLHRFSGGSERLAKVNFTPSVPLPSLASLPPLAVMAETQLAAVKEYIAKYNLEDELSAGVNLAIKQNSDDPFRVISDYLRTLAKVLWLHEHC